MLRATVLAIRFTKSFGDLRELTLFGPQLVVAPMMSPLELHESEPIDY